MHGQLRLGDFMRIHSILLAAVACAGAGVPAIAAPAPSHVYDLNGSLADALGGPAASLIGGPTLGATGVSFLAGQGLSLSSADFSDGQTFSIAVDFRLDSLIRYNRILNFDGSDNGLYIHQGDGLGAPAVNYYHSVAYNGATFTAGDMHQLLFTRDADGISVYLDGVDALDTAAFASSAVSGAVKLFIDDQTEMAPSGFVNSVCTFNSKLGAGDAAALAAGGSCGNALQGSGVPEPASWALLVGGFGLVGGAMRGRRIAFAR